MSNNQMYWHRYLKQRSISKSKGGMFSIRDMASVVHETLYNEAKKFSKLQAKKYLKEEKQKLISHKNLFTELSTNGCAYFIGNTEFRWVKIGRATNVMDRLSSIQTGCPFELTVLAHIPTSNPTRTERKLHMKFKNSRCRGEWFDLSDDMVSFINELRGQYEPYKNTINI